MEMGTLNLRMARIPLAFFSFASRCGEEVFTRVLRSVAASIANQETTFSAVALFLLLLCKRKIIDRSGREISARLKPLVIIGVWGTVVHVPVGNSRDASSPNRS